MVQRKDIAQAERLYRQIDSLRETRELAKDGQITVSFGQFASSPVSLRGASHTELVRGIILDDIDDQIQIAAASLQCLGFEA